MAESFFWKHGNKIILSIGVVVGFILLLFGYQTFNEVSASNQIIINMYKSGHTPCSWMRDDIDVHKNDFFTSEEIQVEKDMLDQGKCSK